MKSSLKDTSALVAKFLAATALPVFCIHTSSAATVNWDGTTGSFTDPTNWVGDSVPVAGDNATIANGGTAIIADGDIINVSELTPGSGDDDGGRGVGSGTLNITGGQVTVSGWYNPARWSNDASVTGTVNQSGGTVTTHILGLADGAGNTGIYNLSGGSLTVTSTTNESLLIGMGGADSTFNMTGGTLDAQGQVWIANGGTNSKGTMDISGGTVTFNDWVAVGRDGTGSNGTMNISGTANITKTAAKGNFVLNGYSSTLNQTGGTLTVQSETWIAEFGDRSGVWNASGGVANLQELQVGRGGTGTMTISDTAEVTATNVVLARYTGSNGTLNLDGGILTANGLTKGHYSGEPPVFQSGTATLNFNGGTLRAGADNANFLGDLASGDIHILEGGLVFDTNGFNVTITQDLSGVGGLEKIGEGILTLMGLNTYEGDTLIGLGELSIENPYLADNSSVLLNGGVLNLNFVGTDTVCGLYFDGVAQALGTWGAIGSGAQFETDRITGPGMLTVVPEPSTIALGIGGMLGLIALSRRRRKA